MIGVKIAELIAGMFRIEIICRFFAPFRYSKTNSVSGPSFRHSSKSL